MLLLTDRPFRLDLFEKRSHCFFNKVSAAVTAAVELVDCKKQDRLRSSRQTQINFQLQRTEKVRQRKLIVFF